MEVFANIRVMRCPLGVMWLCGWMVSLLLALPGCGDGSSGPTLVHAGACTGTFNACGGDPTGTWSLTGACIDGDLVAALNAEMAADYPACADTYSAAGVALGGSVTYGDGKYTFDATMEIIQSFTYTPACVAQLSNGVALSAAVCSQLEQGLNRESGGKATCSYVGTNCDCEGTLTQTNDTSGSYSISGSTIIEDSGTTYQFCVEGASMSQREVVAGNVYGITQMTRR
jgi:hypothetical protein